MNLPKVYSDDLLSISDSNLTVLNPETPIDLPSMTKAILFVMARWSMASQVAFRPLAKVLSSLGDLGDTVLYIADTDYESTEAFFAQVGDIPGGYGETYWISNGQVLRQLAGYKEDSQSTIRQYTEELLRAE